MRSAPEESLPHCPSVTARSLLPRLCSWVDNSLQMYKFELGKVLYPAFVHSFITIAQVDKDSAKAFLDDFRCGGGGARD